MSAALSTPQTNVIAALYQFLTTILPGGTEVVEGYDNRVPEPQSANYVVMTELRSSRLATNQNSSTDTSFTASSSGTTLTVTQMLLGTIQPKYAPLLFGPGVVAGTTIQTQLSGTPGGVGTYQLSAANTIASQKMSAGGLLITSEWLVTYQIDFHGPSAPDNARVFATLFRDEYATDLFGSYNLGDITPIQADEPRQLPFTSGEQQYELRQVVEAQMQVNETIFVPYQFADALAVNIVEVEASYPP